MPPKPLKVPGKGKVSFRWSPYHLDMANYLSDNYTTYKGSLGGQKKMDWLRKMRDHLGIACSDVQLKNGFTHFLEKYTSVKAKLNQSGFGIDPEKDATLEKGWILKQCPYFDILDRILGDRQNITPPAVLSTSSGVTVSLNESQLETENDPSGASGSHSRPDCEAQDENDELLSPTSSPRPTATDDVPVNGGDRSDTPSYVRQALSGISLKKKELSMKTPLGVFAKIMSERNSEIVSFEREKFEEEKKYKVDCMEVERLKVNSQIEIEKRKLDLEREKLEEQRQEREHAIKKLKMQQDFEIKKLELEIKLKELSKQ